MNQPLTTATALNQVDVGTLKEDIISLLNVVLKVSSVERLTAVTLTGSNVTAKGGFTHSMSCPCRAHAVPLP
jgi:hypothetical protein